MDLRWNAPGLVTTAECEGRCLAARNCTAIEMTGCTGRVHCWGHCSLLSGSGRDIHRAACADAGDRRTYLRPSTRAACTPGRNPCAANALCRIVRGAFNCTCRPGTFGDGTVCSTFTPTATPTATLSPTPTATLTGTATPTPALTASPSPSPTATPTPSVVPTATPELPLCVGGPASGGGGAVSFSGAGQCAQDLTLGPGSTSLRSRKVFARLLSLSAGEVTLRYTPSDVGRAQQLPLASVAEVVVVLVFAPPAAGGVRARGRASGDDRVAVDVYTVYTASALLLWPLCCGVCGAALVVVAGCWRGGRCLPRARHPPPEWLRNPRLRDWRARVALLSGAWCFSVAGGWILVALLTSHPEGRPDAVVYAAVAVAGAGAALLLALLVWVQRDPITFYCPICGEQVSRWRFVGRYLPPVDGRRARRKAHTRHVACVHCAEPVIVDGWLQAPLHRPWHEACWRKHCKQFVDDAEVGIQWFRTQVLHPRPLSHRGLGGSGPYRGREK